MHHGGLSQTPFGWSIFLPRSSLRLCIFRRLQNTQVATLKLKNSINEMDGKNYEMTILVREINRMNEENQKLNTMLKRMSSSYNDLQKHIGSLVEKKQQLTRIDGSEICNGNDPSKYNLNSKILSPKSVHVDSSGAVSRQSCFLSNCHERVQKKEGKKAKFIEDQQLPSKKRKMNYIQQDQIQNGSSFMDDGILYDEAPNKKFKALSNWSSEQMPAVPKRIVSVRTTSEASLISDGCHWRKYGQKSTRNNPRPRSYYKCAAAPSCPVKKQVQRSAEDPTIVVTTYEGEHTHSLSPLAMAIMDAGLSNQLIGEGLNRGNFLADDHFIPFSTARISTFSPFPTITLDLTENQPNPGLQVKQHNPGLHLEPSHLAAGSFQHLNSLAKDIGHIFDQSSIMDSVASIKADPNFTAALAVAIAGSMLKLGAPTKEMPRCRPAMQYTDGSTQQASV